MSLCLSYVIHRACVFLFSFALTADGISPTLVYVYSSVLTLKKVRRGKGNYTWWQDDFGESQIRHLAEVTWLWYIKLSTLTFTHLKVIGTLIYLLAHSYDQLYAVIIVVVMEIQVCIISAIYFCWDIKQLCLKSYLEVIIGDPGIYIIFLNINFFNQYFLINCSPHNVP